jgi:hypothetical protein
MMGRIPETRLAGAAEFLLALQGFQLRTNGRWVFRGQRDGNWHLIPSAWRDCHLAPPSDGGRRTVGHQVMVEVDRLRRFVLSSAEVGLDLEIPGGDVFDEQFWLSLAGRALSRPDEETGSQDSGPSDWPVSEVLPELALAQHYGQPTRLLDWTESPLMATYFAAREESDAAELAVWALRDEPGERLYRLVMLPRGRNSRLLAQRGVFTVHGHQQLKTDQFEVEGLDQVIVDTRGNPEACIHKFTFPTDKAGELLWLLEKAHITGATMELGYAGVVTALEESSRHRSIPDQVLAGASDS